MSFLPPRKSMLEPPPQFPKSDEDNPAHRKQSKPAIFRMMGSTPWFETSSSDLADFIQEKESPSKNPGSQEARHQDEDQWSVQSMTSEEEKTLQAPQALKAMQERSRQAVESLVSSQASVQQQRESNEQKVQEEDDDQNQKTEIEEKKPEVINPEEKQATQLKPQVKFKQRIQFFSQNQTDAKPHVPRPQQYKHQTSSQKRALQPPREPIVKVDTNLLVHKNPKISSATPIEREEKSTQTDFAFDKALPNLAPEALPNLNEEPSEIESQPNADAMTQMPQVDNTESPDAGAIREELARLRAQVAELQAEKFAWEAKMERARQRKAKNVEDPPLCYSPEHNAGRRQRPFVSSLGSVNHTEFNAMLLGLRNEISQCSPRTR